MNFGNTPESSHFVDDTNPSIGQALKTYVGQFLYHHGIVNDASGHPYDPNAVSPFGRNAPPLSNVPVGADGRRSDIDWGSNANIPGAPQGLMSMAAAHQQQQNDAMARRMGFRDAATASAYYQKQQQMRTGPVPGPDQSGSLMQRLFSIHPSVLLGHVLDKWNQADGSSGQ